MDFERWQAILMWLACVAGSCLRDVVLERGWRLAKFVMLAVKEKDFINVVHTRSTDAVEQKQLYGLEMAQNTHEKRNLGDHNLDGVLCMG